MNYYERHIGDYLKDTAHLSLLEHGIYTRLMDVYYTREGAIPDDQAARLVGARSKEELSALQAVLREFFVLEESGCWVQMRCEREITRFQDKQRKAKASAEARWSHTDRNANGSPNAMRTHSEGNADRMPRAPVPSLQTPDTNTPLAPKGAFEDFWQAYPRKVGKGAAERAFAKLRPSADVLAKMVAAIAVQAASDQWRKDRGQFIPHPSTWLNEQRWRDGDGVVTADERFAGSV